jgi:large subunit ribosomal protein L35
LRNSNKAGNNKEKAMPRKAPKGKYKLKTHRATAKRFKVTGSGKVMRTKGGKSHLRRNTSRRTKALFTETVEVKGRNIIKRVKRLAPYLRRHKLNPSS